MSKVKNSLSEMAGLPSRLPSFTDVLTLQGLCEIMSMKEQNETGFQPSGGDSLIGRQRLTR
jgi:hypothetical protein